MENYGKINTLKVFVPEHTSGYMYTIVGSIFFYQLYINISNQGGSFDGFIAELPKNINFVAPYLFPPLVNDYLHNKIIPSVCRFDSDNRLYLNCNDVGGLRVCGILFIASYK